MVCLYLVLYSIVIWFCHRQKLSAICESKNTYICSKNSYGNCYVGNSKEFRESRWLQKSFGIVLRIPDELFKYQTKYYHGLLKRYKSLDTQQHCLFIWNFGVCHQTSIVIVLSHGGLKQFNLVSMISGSQEGLKIRECQYYLVGIICHHPWLRQG